MYLIHLHFITPKACSSKYKKIVQKKEKSHLKSEIRNF